MDGARTLREARRQAGLTQRALAERVRVPQATVARIESRAVVPRIDTLDRLLTACGFALEGVQRPGMGVDRASIRRLRRLTPAERLRLAAQDARNLDRLLAEAKRR